MARGMLVTGFKMKCPAMELSIGPMDAIFKENLKMGLCTDKVFTPGKMAENTREVTV